MKTRLAAMLVVIAALFAGAAPADAAAPANTTTAVVANYYPGGAQGSDWWYGVYWDYYGAHTVVTARLSWSYMWTLEVSPDLSNLRNAETALCGALFYSYPMVVACGSLVQAEFWWIQHEVYMGTHVYRECLYYRFPAPPLVDFAVTAVYLGRCRV